MPELVVGGAILAGVALSGAQLFKAQKVAQKKVEYDQKLSGLHDNLAKFITLPANCNATLKNFISNGSAISGPLTISALYRCQSGCVDSNTTTNLDFNAYTSGAYQGVSYLSANSFIDNTRTWKVDSMQIVDTLNSTGATRLKITYRLEGRPGVPEKVVNKFIFLNLRFHNGVFKECVGKQEASVNNLQRDMCKSLNLKEISSDGTLAAWDEATQTCQVTGSRTCLEGEEAYIDNDGAAKCRAVIKSQDAAALENPSTVTCSNPIMVFENNKVKVSCPP